MILRSLTLVSAFMTLSLLNGCVGEEKPVDDTGTLPAEDCTNDADDDGDGDVDCDDADCASDPACEELPTTELDCADTLDDDGDGDIDCDDTDCAEDPACAPTTELDCSDDLDDDGDGLIDCADDDCADDAACEEIPADEVDCTNTLDDDGDGATDCDDTDCAGDPACLPASELDCANTLDDDGDGDEDCADADCADDPACLPASELDCSNTLDDDGDGATDCDDPECASDAACAPSTELDCANTLDDDGDGPADCDDPDCAADAACLPAMELDCSNTVDDDTDGATDCADSDCALDAACVVSFEADCTNGVDDDGDGLLDCGDSDCGSDAACLPTSELDCADTLDDDGDGAVDCDDSDCAADTACVPAECSDGDLGSVIGPAVATGTTLGAGDDYASSCSTSSAAEDVSWSWTAPADGTYTISTDGSSYDTVMTIWGADCGTESTCDDDDGESTQSLEVITAAAGEEIVIVVDGYSTYSGDYVLNIYTASETDCRDSVDEDGDGGADCDDTDCAADATCIPEPLCEDGLDDDLDGDTDCDDSDCADLLLCTNPCADDELGSVVGASVAVGTTLGGGDDTTASCASSPAEDVAWLWVAPADGIYTFDTEGSSYDTLLSVQTGECAGAELACGVDTGSELLSSASVTLLAGDEVVVNVDGYGSAGDYVLNVWADAEVDCSDGGDDDLDGDTDCADSECASDIACLPESVCDDAVDEDVDGDTDCLDSECAADAACDPSLADYDLGSVYGTAVATGTTVAASNTFTPSCTYAGAGAGDLAYAWVAPTSGTWTFDLSSSSYDTALTLLDPDATVIECDDDDGSSTRSLISRSVNAGQMVIIVIDGYSTGTGAYQLDIY